MNIVIFFFKADDKIIQDILGHTAISRLENLVVELFHYEGLLLKNEGEKI